MAQRTASRWGGGFSGDRLRLPLAGLGIFGVLAGLSVWLVEGGFTNPSRFLLAGGILLLGVTVALDPEDVWAKLTGRSALYSGNALVLSVAILGILGLLNVLGSRYQGKWDLTQNQRFTLSEQSVRVAETLPQPVTVTGYFPASDTSQQALQGLLNDYAARSNGKLTYQFVDPEAEPAAAIQAGVRDYGTIVYQMGDKKQNSTGTQERDITTSLIKLTRPQKKLYFSVGNGERKLDGTDNPGYSQINQALGSDNFVVEPLNLITTRAVPDDAAGLVVAGPTNALAQEQLDAIKAYVDGGGGLILLLDPQSKAIDGFNTLLSRWNVQVTNTLVYDPGKAFGRDPRVPVVDSYPPQAITRDLATATFYPAATAIQVGGQGPQGSTVTPIAQTTERAWAETDFQGTNPQPGENELTGPLALAVAIQQDVPNPSAGQTPPTDGSNTVPTARIFVAGTANIVANVFLNAAQSGNPDLFLNAANWVAEQDDLVAIRPVQNESRTLLLTSSQINLVRYTSWLFLPLAVLAAGAAVWWTRR